MTEETNVNKTKVSITTIVSFSDADAVIDLLKELGVDGLDFAKKVTGDYEDGDSAWEYATKVGINWRIKVILIIKNKCYVLAHSLPVNEMMSVFDAAKQFHALEQA